MKNFNNTLKPPSQQFQPNKSTIFLDWSVSSQSSQHLSSEEVEECQINILIDHLQIFISNVMSDKAIAPQRIRKRESATSIKDYIILQKLGQGGYGTVYACLLRGTTTIRAMKMISLQKFQRKDWKYLQSEISIGCKVSKNNKNILQLHECFIQNQNLYIILDFCQMGDLFWILSKKDKLLLEQDQAKLVIAQLLNALNQLHQNIKAENILVTIKQGNKAHQPYFNEQNYRLCEIAYDEIQEEKQKLKQKNKDTNVSLKKQDSFFEKIYKGIKRQFSGSNDNASGLTKDEYQEKQKLKQEMKKNGYIVKRKQLPKISQCIFKLCDFGFSSQMLKGNVMKTYCGTLDYMAPQILKDKPYGYSVDIWAVGVLAYQIMQGETPFDRPSKKKMVSDIKKQKYYYHENISQLARGFIDSILKAKENERPSVKELIQHPWIKEQYSRFVLEIDGQQGQDLAVDEVKIADQKQEQYQQEEVTLDSDQQGFMDVENKQNNCNYHN